MKTFLYSSVIFVAMLPVLNYIGFALHTRETKFGQCLGVSEVRDNDLEYEISRRNVLITTIFLESIITPAVVVANNLYCPIGRRW